MNRFLNFTKNFLITAAILVCGFLLSLFMQKEWGNQTLIPSIFLLDVFLVSVITDGFLYGAVASVISILAVNYAFTFPYFKINFTIPENMISAVIMIAIAVITCGFTNKLKSQEQAARDRGEYKISSMCTPLAFTLSPSWRACWRPRSVRGLSVMPQILFSTFQTVSPWRVK